MGLLQDETFFDALKLALAAAMLSYSTPQIVPVQIPIAFLAPPNRHDLMNPMNTKPFTISHPFQSIPNSTKDLRPLYVTIPLYTIFPLCAVRPLAFTPQGIPSPQPFNSAFWDVVRRTLEHSLYGAAVLAWFSEIAKATPEKDFGSLRDDQEPPSYDSLDLGSLPSIPTEDDLLRVDMTELESIPSSELYFGEREVAVAPRRRSIRAKPTSPLRSASSETSLVTILEDTIACEALSGLFQIPDEELYFTLGDLGELGATPPWPFSTSASAPSVLSSA